VRLTLLGKRLVAASQALLIAGLLLALPAAPARAIAAIEAARATSLTQYKVDGWQTEQGLPHNTVAALQQTRDGYLWVGTLAGLARFDGVRFTTVDVGEVPEIATLPVSGLFEDAQGKLWIAHNKGAAIYRDGKFTRAFAAPATANQRVWAFAQDKAGVIWAATNHGLARWEKGVVKFFGEADGLPTERLRTLAFDRDGVLWIGTTGAGLVSYAAGSFRVFDPATGFPHLHVRAVLADPAGGIWAATAGGGLAHVRDGVIKTYTVADGLPTDQLTALARDIHGQLWIGTWGGGVSRMVGERFSNLASGQGLAGDHIWSLQTDSQGEIWLGTWVSGLVRMRERAFGWLGVPEGLSSDNARSVLQARDGSTWVATAGGGLNHIVGGAITVLGKQDGLPSDELSSLIEARDGALWIGSYTAGAVRLKDGRISTYSHAQGMPSADVRALFEDRHGTIWAATQSGLARFDGSAFTPLRGAGAPAGGVTSIAEDAQGTLWFGTGGEGLARWRDGAFTTLTTVDGLLSNWIMSLHLDPTGALWIGTNGDGMNRLQGGRLGAIRPADGLWDGTILAILEDASANFWVTTNRGFFRVARAELNAFADGRASKVSSRAFGPGDAMRSITFAGGLQPTAALDQAGRLLLPSTKGLVIVDTQRMPAPAQPPSARLERVRVNGVDHAPTAPLTLPPGAATLSIEYGAITLLYAERVRFRYQLDGLSRDWIDAGSNREVAFPALSHGLYHFRVQTSLDGKSWSASTPALAITVQPFFYEATWFAALVVCGVFTVLFVLVRLRLHRLRAHHTEMEQLVAQKTEALRLANEHLSRLSFIDALSGLANRRRFDEVLADEWARACRSGAPLALVIADIDSFKLYNDALGHPEGDRCLAAVAGMFISHARRAADLAARYGGEEFVMLLPNLDLAAALQVAEALRSACETLAIAHPGSAVAPVVTLSLGVAVQRPSDPSPEAMRTLVEDADAALYRAKHEGRNRVCAHLAAPAPAAPTPAPVVP
jgi:diguanylate cyclase (GGDEF)-like protein